jgi:hypothetical protein
MPSSIHSYRKEGQKFNNDNTAENDNEISDKTQHPTYLLRKGNRPLNLYLDLRLDKTVSSTNSMLAEASNVTSRACA